MCNSRDKPPQNNTVNAIPSKGFSKRSRNPLKKNLIASGITNTTNISPTIPTLTFILSIISINYSTNIRNKIHISKEYLTFFHLFSVSARPVLLLPPSHPTIYEEFMRNPNKKHDNLSGRPELRNIQ